MSSILFYSTRVRKKLKKNPKKNPEKKEGPLGVIEHPKKRKVTTIIYVFLRKAPTKKLKGGPFGDIQKILNKSLTKPKKWKGRPSALE